VAHVATDAKEILRPRGRRARAHGSACTCSSRTQEASQVAKCACEGVLGLTMNMVDGGGRTKGPAAATCGRETHIARAVRTGVGRNWRRAAQRTAHTTELTVPRQEKCFLHVNTHRSFITLVSLQVQGEGARRARELGWAAPQDMYELRCIRRGLCKSTWAREHMARRGALPPLLFCRACGGANAREKRQRGRGGLRGGRRCTGLAILGHGPAARSERACAGVIWLPRTLPRDSEKNIGVDLCVHRRLCRSRC
jgi:hypothetical protein